MKILRAEISGALRHFLLLFLIELVHLFTQSGTFLLHFADRNILFSKFLEIAHRLVGVFLRLAENSLCLLGCIGDHLFFSCVDLFLILGKALLQGFDFRAGAGKLFFFAFQRDPVLLESGQNVFKRFILLADFVFCLVDDVVRQAEFAGNRKRITLSRNADEQAVCRA